MKMETSAWSYSDRTTLVSTRKFTSPNSRSKSFRHAICRRLKRSYPANAYVLRDCYQGCGALQRRMPRLCRACSAASLISADAIFRFGRFRAPRTTWRLARRGSPRNQAPEPTKNTTWQLLIGAFRAFDVARTHRPRSEE